MSIRVTGPVSSGNSSLGPYDVFTLPWGATLNVYNHACPQGIMTDQGFQDFEFPAGYCGGVYQPSYQPGLPNTYVSGEVPGNILGTLPLPGSSQPTTPDFSSGLDASTLYFIAVRAGDVEKAHEALDAWNRARAAAGQPPVPPIMSDDEIALNAHTIDAGQATTELNNLIQSGAYMTGLSTTTFIHQDVAPSQPPAGQGPLTTADTSSIPTKPSNAPSVPATTGASAAPVPETGGVQLPIGAGLQSQIQAAAGSSMLTADQWNYYYSLVTGQTAPAPEEYGIAGDSRFTPLSFNDWWSHFSSRIGAQSGGGRPAAATPSTGLGTAVFGGGNKHNIVLLAAAIIVLLIVFDGL